MQENIEEVLRILAAFMVSAPIGSLVEEDALPNFNPDDLAEVRAVLFGNIQSMDGKKGSITGAYLIWCTLNNKLMVYKNTPALVNLMYAYLEKALGAAAIQAPDLAGMPERILELEPEIDLQGNTFKGHFLLLLYGVMP